MKAKCFYDQVIKTRAIWNFKKQSLKEEDIKFINKIRLAKNKGRASCFPKREKGSVADGMSMKRAETRS